MSEHIYPQEIGVVKFKDGTYDVYPELADIAPSVKYHLDDKYIALEEKYKDMVKFYDKHVGTPCEQIRHAEQVAGLEAQVKRLREALEYIGGFYKSCENSEQDFAGNQDEMMDVARYALAAPIEKNTTE